MPAMYQALTAKAVRYVPRALAGRCIGRLAASGASRHAVRPFARALGIDLSEAEHGVDAYPTLADFFVRRLRPGARPIDPRPDVLVSPVDGVVSDCGRIDRGTAVLVKGVTLSFPELLGPDRAEPFAGGGFSVHYLSPRDYHWIHAPSAGRVTAWAHVPGDYYPVFPRSLDEFGCVFTRNERVIAFMDTPRGRLAVAMVAAMGVGNISLTFADVSQEPGRIQSHVELGEPVDVERGAPLGTFHLGSTVILAWEDPALAPLPSACGSHLKMGEAFAARR